VSTIDLTGDRFFPADLVLTGPQVVAVVVEQPPRPGRAGAAPDRGLRSACIL